MKVAFVVQRYGEEVCGGSELHCRQVAERMARHWDVEVLTSCAIDHFTWRNEYPPGLTSVNRVPVRRFPVDAPRDLEAFDRLSSRLYGHENDRADEVSWMNAQGPYSTAFNDFIRGARDRYDFFIFFTYLYAFTFHGLPAVKGKSALVPTAHDEPPIYLGIYRDVFRLPSALIFNTHQERDFVNARFGTRDVIQDVVGVGVEAPVDVRPERFRERYARQLAESPFVLYVGRVEEAKGCRELFDHFMRFREDAPERRVKLVVIGSRTMEIPDHPDIVALGFVDERDKFDAIAAAEVLVLSSPFESLSMVALEAWRLGKCVLANGTCDVLRDQCIRSDGGLWYETYAEFRETLALLLGRPALRERLGRSGSAFVARFYEWPTIEAKYLSITERALRPPPRDGGAPDAPS